MSSTGKLYRKISGCKELVNRSFRGEASDYIDGKGVFGDDENVLKLDNDNGCTLL